MKLITFDIETWGLKREYLLQPWRAATGEAGVWMNAIWDGEQFLDEIPKTYQEDYLGAKNIFLCGWNLKFDLAFLLAEGNQFLMGKRYIDGMLLLKRLYPDLKTYGLKAALERFKNHLNCGYVSDYNKDIEFKEGRPENAYTQNELDCIDEYNKRDAKYTHALIKYLTSISSFSTISQAIRESTMSVFFADSWRRGINLDYKNVLIYGKGLSKKLLKIENLFKEVKLTKEIVSSPKQLREYISKRLKITLHERTEKGELSVNANVLKNLYYEAEGSNKLILKLILKYKELLTEHNKFAIPAQECKNIAYSEPMLSSTYTGRLTYKMYQNITETKHFKNGRTKAITKKIRIGLPIHQIKRGTVRDMFIPPKGFKLVELDFSGQEMRLMAAIAKEPTMIRLFNEGKDLHAFTGASIMGMSYDGFLKLQQNDPKTYKDMRFLGKLTNLSLQYRLSANGLYKQWHDKYGLVDKTLEDAERARETYISIYRGVSEYWEKSISNAKERGFTKNVIGRQCLLHDWTYENYYKSEQTAINYPIQSTGAEQKILALYEMRKLIIKEGVLFGWDLHDGLYFYVPDCLCTTDIVLLMAEKMGNLPYEKAWAWTPPVKFPVEAKIGDSWGSLQIIT
jgi:DNA polymerase I-like protein with 3'-5' exonuclease and polymerase domains